ncbi:hypothetical protein ACFQ9X_31875 [Catenulispora yoronensis]
MNAGQRAAAEASSAASTGTPVAAASRVGPCPSVNCRSSSSALTAWAPKASTVPAAPVPTTAHRPSTPSAVAAAAQAVIDSPPPVLFGVEVRSSNASTIAIRSLTTPTPPSL